MATVTWERGPVIHYLPILLMRKLRSRVVMSPARFMQEAGSRWDLNPGHLGLEPRLSDASQ
jgi:hypothetical protein